MRLVQPGRSAAWTRDRIEKLSIAEVRQLRANAERLGEAEIVGTCDEVLKARSTKSAAPKTPVKAKRQVAA